MSGGWRDSSRGGRPTAPGVRKARRPATDSVAIAVPARMDVAYPRGSALRRRAQGPRRRRPDPGGSRRRGGPGLRFAVRAARHRTSRSPGGGRAARCLARRRPHAAGPFPVLGIGARAGGRRAGPSGPRSTAPQRVHGRAAACLRARHARGLGTSRRRAARRRAGRAACLRPSRRRTRTPRRPRPGAFALVVGPGRWLCRADAGCLVGLAGRWRAGDVPVAAAALRSGRGTGGDPPWASRRPGRHGGSHRPGFLRRHVVVRRAGTRRARSGARDRRPRARQRPSLRRTPDRPARGRRHARDPGDQPAAPARHINGGNAMAASQLTEIALPAHRAVPYGGDAGRLTLDTLPGRDLDPEELRALVASIACEPALWERHVGFDDDERVYASLHRDAHVDVWLLCWTPANDTGWHDHDISAGAVAVVAGELRENNLTVAIGGVETRISAGKAFSFGPEHIHRLNGALPGSVSVHAYSPPLWRMGQYAVSDAGVLRRVSVSYADELRPLE